MSPVKTRQTTSATTEARKAATKIDGGESALQFLHHENHSRQRRVKGRRQAGAGPGADQRPALALAPPDAEPGRDHQPGRSAHLDRGALATQGQAAPDAGQAGQELDRQEPLPAHSFPHHDRLEVGYAAARRLRGEPAHQPEAEAAAESPAGQGQGKAWPGAAAAATKSDAVPTIAGTRGKPKRATRQPSR